MKAPILRSTKAPARLEDGIRIYAVGDVHGRRDLLLPLLKRVRAHLCANPAPRPIMVFLGDYFDRGPSTREVIDELIALKREQETVILEGNHERYVVDFLENPALLPAWLQWGGLETLRSYGLSPEDFLNSTDQELLAMSLKLALHRSGHLDFLTNLETSFTCGDFFFVHAGVRPGIALDQQRAKDLLEIRDDFLRSDADFGKIVVHGHTPAPTPEVCSNRINIDTGAYATGRLSCLVLERDELEFI